MANRAAYLHSLQSLLPEGQAWTREPDANLTKLLDVLAAELAKVDTRIQRMHNEADPRRCRADTACPKTPKSGILNNSDENSQKL